jgi:hypothetical protein
VPKEIVEVTSVDWTADLDIDPVRAGAVVEVLAEAVGR